MPLWVFRQGQWLGKLLEAWFQVSLMLCLGIRSKIAIFDRPGVAGAVLQTALLLTD